MKRKNYFTISQLFTGDGDDDENWAKQKKFLQLMQCHYKIYSISDSIQIHTFLTHF